MADSLSLHGVDSIVVEAHELGDDCVVTTLTITKFDHHANESRMSITCFSDVHGAPLRISPDVECLSLQDGEDDPASVKDAGYTIKVIDAAT